MLERCEAVRIAIYGEQYPYVVPVSFGMEVVDNKSAEEIERLQTELDSKMATKNGRIFDIVTLVTSLVALVMIIIHFLI